MSDSAPTPDTALLTVSRTSPEDVRERQVILTLDGQPFATLLYGQTASRPVAPGPHRLRANNTLVWKTVDLELAPGESAHFDVVNRPGPGTRALVAMLGVGPIYLSLGRRP